ncbi:hypothetical protein PENARI_c056G09167 [Penicillium arizonense]|uniref:Uncharacterized protein n=1 Tax=Penicillium arizonense TaxID=1835702 RepID=A0A1F5L2G9_PENAI|nr:hypothetical protein PENARI_c056G09167 [Penicillium arizonense]OGE47190.1 hypothetical protein PENARI_c056G09167 [Penicillium arizonense]
MWPSCDPRKVGIIAKSLMLLFLHDDVIEYAYSKESDTILETGISLDQSYTNRPTPHDPKGSIFAKFVTETLAADPAWGPGMLRGMIAYAKFTNKNQHMTDISFPSLSSYIEYRCADVANDLGAIEGLVVKHCSLTNDLYSFDKECQEQKTAGAMLVNVVQCLKDVLGVSSQTAKMVAMGVIWEVERELASEYDENVALGRWSPSQTLYVERLIEAASGNGFYSATAGRYSKQYMLRNTESCCGSEG